MQPPKTGLLTVQDLHLQKVYKSSNYISLGFSYKSIPQPDLSCGESEIVFNWEMCDVLS